MAITAGSYKLGPDDGTLSVRTKKAGAAAKAGHNLLIEVTSWSATVTVGDHGAPTSVELVADSSSLRVLEGTGGMTALGDDDKAGIKQTIDKEVLKRTPITFRSTAVDRGAGGVAAGVGGGAGEGLSVTGALELAGARRPIAFELTADGDGRLAGAATVKQSAWGIKPYSALFGTLKVVDEVIVELTARLRSG